MLLIRLSAEKAILDTKIATHSRFEIAYATYAFPFWVRAESILIQGALCGGALRNQLCATHTLHAEFADEFHRRSPFTITIWEKVALTIAITLTTNALISTAIFNEKRTTYTIDADFSDSSEWCHALVLSEYTRAVYEVSDNSLVMRQFLAFVIWFIEKIFPIDEPRNHFFVMQHVISVHVSFPLNYFPERIKPRGGRCGSI
jgi:hypothetical protein